MTGYGNFRYYAQTKDFSLGRVLQSLWRLNFLAAACCIVFRNSYMLYYICPMHTLFTLAVYAALAIAPSTNTSPRALALKFGACVAIVAAVWEVPGVFDALWGPLKPLVGYTDPRRPSPDALHEWVADEFRMIKARQAALLGVKPPPGGGRGGGGWCVADGGGAAASKL